MKELIEKIRLYCSTHSVDEFTISMVNVQIDQYEKGIIDERFFKINISVLLQINIDDL